ncbi:antitoxin [Streptomyces sp. NPDC000345]|uniref:antitoxin n=1 Tax=unclassified Streptomyces TaxID=2593676 RepID=UPI0036966878
MGILDRFRHHSKAKDTSDAAERKVNERTGDKYQSQVDDAQQRIEGTLGMDRERPDRPEGQ